MRGSHRVGLALLGLVTLVMTSCRGARVVTLPGAEAARFAAEVDPQVTNMLEGLSAGDYAQHTRDFDEELREQIDEVVVFPQVYDEIIGVAGAYRSHVLVRVERQPNAYLVAVYDVTFSADPHVTLRVVFRRDDPAHHITGLWFDSEKLRQSQQGP